MILPSTCVCVCVCVCACMHSCVRACVCVVTRPQQLIGHITSRNSTMEFGMPDGINALVMQRRLQWLCHMGRMSDDCLLKQLLFGELLTTRSAHYDGGMWYQGTSRVWVLIHSVDSVQLRIALNHLMLVNLILSIMSGSAVEGFFIDVGTLLVISGSVVVNLLKQGRWSFTVGVGTSFVGKVTSLDISDIVYLSGVCAQSSLFQDPAIVFRQAVTRLPGVCVCACARVHACVHACVHVLCVCFQDRYIICINYLLIKGVFMCR